MVRLCAWCGEEVPTRSRCPRCAAAEPTWEPTPSARGARLGSALSSLASIVSGLSCLLAAFALCYEWIGPDLGQRILQVAVAIVVVGFGVPVGIVLLANGITSLLDRRWIHPGVEATATTRWGRVRSASGGGRSAGPVLTVPGNTLSGRQAFTHYGALRATLAATFGLRTSPPRVDLALLAALLSLAGRRRVQLRLSRNVTWSHNGAKVARRVEPEGVEVRRIDALPEAASADLLEARLLDALASPTVSVVPAEGLLPYRVAAVVEATSAEAPWVPLPAVASAMSQGDPRFRRALRHRLESLTPTDDSASSAEAVWAELRSVLDATGEHSLGVVFVRQIAQGFAARGPAPVA